MGSYSNFTTCRYCGYEYAIERTEGSMYSTYQCSMCGAKEHQPSDSIWEEMRGIAFDEADEKGLDIDSEEFEDYVSVRATELVGDYLQEEEGVPHRPTKRDVQEARIKSELINLVLSLYERPEGLFIEAGANDAEDDEELYRGLIDGTFNYEEYDY